MKMRRGVIIIEMVMMIPKNRQSSGMSYRSEMFVRPEGKDTRFVLENHSAFQGMVVRRS